MLQVLAAAMLQVLAAAMLQVLAAALHQVLAAALHIAALHMVRERRTGQTGQGWMTSGALLRGLK